MDGKVRSSPNLETLQHSPQVCLDDHRRNVLLPYTGSASLSSIQRPPRECGSNLASSDTQETRTGHLAALIERYAKVASAVRAAIDETDNAGDVDTADLFTAFSRALDKNLWFLEAHLQ
jgi:starvation-inducible DNA-binding protein